MDIQEDKANTSLTETEREFLRYYIATENEDISAWFVLRFFYYSLVRWALIFVAAALAVKLLVPDNTISLRSSLYSTIAALFAGLMSLSIYNSFASVAHWRLLRRIFDWDTVRRLHDKS